MNNKIISSNSQTFAQSFFQNYLGLSRMPSLKGYITESASYQRAASFYGKAKITSSLALNSAGLVASGTTLMFSHELEPLLLSKALTILSGLALCKYGHNIIKGEDADLGSLANKALLFISLPSSLFLTASIIEGNHNPEHSFLKGALIWSATYLSSTTLLNSLYNIWIESMSAKSKK